MHLYHPWRRLRDLIEVRLDWHDDGPGAWCHYGEQVVSVRTGMTQAERRSALTHELVHLERGPSPRGYRAAEERHVSAEAARRLIGIQALGEALAWAYDLDEAAEDLWVDVATLRARLDHLHPSERHFLRRRLSAADETVAGIIDADEQEDWAC